MMTRNEAVERAERIWGAREVLAVHPAPPGHWWVDLRHDERGHMLDSNGHTACHPVCAAKEDRLP